MCRGGNVDVVDAPSTLAPPNTFIHQPDFDNGLTIEERTWLDATIELELSSQSSPNPSSSSSPSPSPLDPHEPEHQPSIPSDLPGSSNIEASPEDLHATLMELDAPVHLQSFFTAATGSGLTHVKRLDGSENGTLSLARTASLSTPPSPLPSSLSTSCILPGPAASQVLQVKASTGSTATTTISPAGRGRVIPRRRPTYPMPSVSSTANHNLTLYNDNGNTISSMSSVTNATNTNSNSSDFTTPPVTPTRSLRRTSQLPPLSPSSSSSIKVTSSSPSVAGGIIREGADAVSGAAGEVTTRRPRPRPRPLDILKECRYENEDEDKDELRIVSSASSEGPAVGYSYSYDYGRGTMVTHTNSNRGRGAGDSLMKDDRGVGSFAASNSPALASDAGSSASFAALQTRASQSYALTNTGAAGGGVSELGTGPQAGRYSGVQHHYSNSNALTLNPLNRDSKGMSSENRSDFGFSHRQERGDGISSDSANLIAVEIPSSPFHIPSLALSGASSPSLPLASPSPELPRPSPLPSPSSASSSTATPLRQQQGAPTTSMTTPTPPSPVTPSRGNTRTLRHTTTSLTAKTAAMKSATALSTLPGANPPPTPSSPTPSAAPAPAQPNPQPPSTPAQIPTPASTPSKPKLPNPQSQWIYRQVKPLPRSRASISGPGVGFGMGSTIDFASDLAALQGSANPPSIAGEAENGPPGRSPTKGNMNMDAVQLIGAFGSSQSSFFTGTNASTITILGGASQLTMAHGRSQSQPSTLLPPSLIPPSTAALVPSSGSSSESSSGASSSSFFTVGAETATSIADSSSMSPPPSASLPSSPQPPPSPSAFWTSFLKPRSPSGSRASTSTRDSHSRSRSYSEKSLRPFINLKEKLLMSNITGSFSTAAGTSGGLGSNSTTSNITISPPSSSKPNISGPIGISSSNGLIRGGSSNLFNSVATSNKINSSAGAGAGTEAHTGAAETGIETDGKKATTGVASTVAPPSSPSPPPTDRVPSTHLRTTSVSSVNSSGSCSTHAVKASVSSSSLSSGGHSHTSSLIRPPKQEQKPYKSCLSTPSHALAPSLSSVTSDLSTPTGIGAPAMTGLSKVVSCSTASTSTSTSASTTRTSSSTGSGTGGTTNKSVKFADMPTVHYASKLYWDFDPKELGIIRDDVKWEDGEDADGDEEDDEDYYEDAEDDGSASPTKNGDPAEEDEDEQMSTPMDIDEAMDIDQAVDGIGGGSSTGAASKSSNGSEPDETSIAQDVFGPVISAHTPSSILTIPTTNRTQEIEQETTIVNAEHSGLSLSKSGSISSKSTTSVTSSSPAITATAAAAKGLKRIISLRRKSTPASPPSSESIPKRRRRLAMSSNGSGSPNIDGDTTKTRPVISGPFVLGSVLPSTPPASYGEENPKWKLTPSKLGEGQKDQRRRYHHHQVSTSSVLSVPILPSSSSSTSSVRRRRVPRSSSSSLRRNNHGRSGSGSGSGSGSSTPTGSTTTNSIGFPLRNVPSLDSFKSGKSIARSVKSLPGSVMSTLSTGKFRMWLGKIGRKSGGSSAHSIHGAAGVSQRVVAVHGDIGV